MCDEFMTCMKLSFSSQNLEAWEEAKKEVAQIPDHPNRLPEGVDANGPSTNGRRDSTATVNGR